MLDWLRRALSKRAIRSVGPDRRVRYSDEVPPEGFVLAIALMMVFFAGLIALQVVHLLVLGTWNDAIFGGIMLVVGTIVGAIWGRTEG